jgi:predicted TIM-barrel fold metal-dependent hydrolase
MNLDHDGSQGDLVMLQPHGPVIDADNHYYEVHDAFTRYLPKEMRRRGLQWVTTDGKLRLMAGEKVTRVLANPTFDPIARPGALIDYFRAKNAEGKQLSELFGGLEPLAEHPEYVDRQARLAVMAQQNIDGALLFPTLGALLQRPLADDSEALHATFHAFNQWLLADWGFTAPLYGAPVIILSDPELALAEVQWALENGASVLAIIPGPVPNRHGGSRSPASRDLDPVWQRINDAGVLVAVHGTDGALDKYIGQWETPNQGFAMFDSVFKLAISHGRTISDTLTAFVCHGLFQRFPNVRIATIETGSNWVTPLLHVLDSVYGKRPQDFAEDPAETIRRHVWVSPFFEDDMADLRDAIGAEQMLFGSDWPHAEGLAAPRDFLHEIPTFNQDEVTAVMGGNLAKLLVPQPA